MLYHKQYSYHYAAFRCFIIWVKIIKCSLVIIEVSCTFWTFPYAYSFVLQDAKKTCSFCRLTNHILWIKLADNRSNFKIMNSPHLS